MPKGRDIYVYDEMEIFETSKSNSSKFYVQQNTTIKQ